MGLGFWSASFVVVFVLSIRLQLFLWLLLPTSVSLIDGLGYGLLNSIVIVVDFAAVAASVGDFLAYVELGLWDGSYCVLAG